MRTLTALLALLLAAPLAVTAGEPPEFAGMLDAHNRVRQSLGLAPLRWSTAGAAEAQRWAEQLAREQCVARYDPGEQRRLEWGQNVLRVGSAQPYEGYKRTPAMVAGRWAQEGEHYDHRQHRCRTTLGTQCGQYLQMIWETTEEVGCGRARCTQGEVWVCNYAPRGLQEDRKPYGNPAPAPMAEVVIGPLECAAVPAVGPGEDYPSSPVSEGVAPKALIAPANAGDR